MNLRVKITCPRCAARTEVHITGAWDIKRVLHQCLHEAGHQYHGGRQVQPGEFAVVFEPPRRTF